MKGVFMKKPPRKLKLDTQTVRQLDNDSLADAQGGSMLLPATHRVAKQRSANHGHSFPFDGDFYEEDTTQTAARDPDHSPARPRLAHQRTRRTARTGSVHSCGAT